MTEDRISVVARIKPGFGNGNPEWIKNGKKNIMRKDGSEIYTFDDVFDQLCTNEKIYEEVMGGIVDAALAGFNTAVCAYGQSGAGKTHTLTGSDTEDGIVQNTFRALLETISKSNDRKYMLRISYIEIYNERIRDLLSDNASDLPIYENKDGVAQIEGLTEIVVTEKAEVERLLEKAQERRQFGETRLNERSSRSHTIIRLTIESHDVKYGGNATRCSIMSMVDLAGSENAAAAGTQSLRQKEGSNINKSLLALSKVVSSLADNQKFIPYRDSKLTRILKPSLGGNSKTAIICCVAPFSMAETSSTLKFAKLAKKIITRPVVNEVSDDGKLAKCLKEIEYLKHELEKTRKENDEEEKAREQKMKLAELMKGILNGRGTSEAAPTMSRKTRRQTWAPGNDVMGLTGRSYSPPCKKERGLGLIEECGGQKSDENIDEVEVVPDSKKSEVLFPLAIPPFVPIEQRLNKKCDAEVQTIASFPEDRTDEVITLKKGNAMLLQQLEEKKARSRELESKLGDCYITLGSMKGSIAQFQEVASTAEVLENRILTAEREKACLVEENYRLKEEIANIKSLMNESETSPSDRSRLLSRIDELYDEMRQAKDANARATDDNNALKDREEQLQIQIKDLKGKLRESESIILAQKSDYRRLIESADVEMNSAKMSWEKEKEMFIKELENLKSHIAKDSQSVIESMKSEIADLNAALAEAHTLASNAKDAAVRELQQHHDAEIEQIVEELQQLRKDNASLANRVEMLIVETESPESDRNELQLLKEELAELREVIELKSKALEIAEKQKNELELSNKMMDVLRREKKELITRLKTKTDSAAVFSSRINALRDEINEKQIQLRTHEVNNEKLRVDNRLLGDRYNALEAEFSTFKKDNDTSIRDKDAKITKLLEQVKNDQHRILTLDTDLAIARKDLEVFRNTVASMAKAQDEAQTLASQDGHLKQKLEELAEELSSVKKAREKAEEDAASKEKMLQKKMEEVVKLEIALNSSGWLKEKAKMEEQISDLQRQLKDVNDALECRQTTSSDIRQQNERKLVEETHSLRQQIKKLLSSKTDSAKADADEKAELKRCLEKDKKEINELKEKIRHYRMQKVNGIQYVDELKMKILKNEKDISEMKQRLLTLNAELQRAVEAKAELERLCKENKMLENNINSATKKKKIESVRPLNEEPECKQQ